MTFQLSLRLKPVSQWRPTSAHPVKLELLDELFTLPKVPRTSYIHSLLRTQELVSRQRNCVECQCSLFSPPTNGTGLRVAPAVRLVVVRYVERLTLKVFLEPLLAIPGGILQREQRNIG